jgi:hypothetical protein
MMLPPSLVAPVQEHFDQGIKLIAIKTMDIILPINPLINLCQSGITLTTTCAARSSQRQFAHLSFADPFVQHTPQGISIHIKVDD